METKRQVGGGDTGDTTALLVARLRTADPQAGALLGELYRDALVRFCWGYLGRMDEAEDAAQDICYKALSAPNIPDAFRPWLYRTARNHCLNLLRNDARRKDVGDLPPASQIHEVLTGHLTRLVRSEEQSRISELVRSLPETQQEVLRLRYVETLSRAEVAEVLDIPESLVKSRLFEGLERLRDLAAYLDEP